MNELNQKLLVAQQQWKQEFYSSVLTGNEGEISCPFSCGVSDELLKSDKKVMIIGQNAVGLGCQYAKYDLPQMQTWSIDYLERQLDVCSDNGEKWNGSPFWQFFRAFKKAGYFPCWNNLEKVVRYKVGETKEFHIENNEREILNKKFAEGKTLLQKEIELVQPDMVILVVGPKKPYYNAVKQALNLDDKQLENYYPNVKQERLFVNLTDIAKLGVPTFWTYHPQFLNRYKSMNVVIDTIIKLTEKEN